jgi:hypothetical protein
VQHLIEVGDRQDHAGVDFLGTHNDGTVDLLKGISGLKVVESHKCADFSTVAADNTVGGDFKGAHIHRQ